MSVGKVLAAAAEEQQTGFAALFCDNPRELFDLTSAPCGSRVRGLTTASSAVREGRTQ